MKKQLELQKKSLIFRCFLSTRFPRVEELVEANQ